MSRCLFRCLFALLQARKVNFTWTEADSWNGLFNNDPFSTAIHSLPLLDGTPTNTVKTNPLGGSYFETSLDVDMSGDYAITSSQVDPETAFIVTRENTFPNHPVNYGCRLAVTYDAIIGDSDDSGQFNSVDLVIAFGLGKYETGVAATWLEGDWNQDGVFDSGDFVFAFASGNYQSGNNALVADWDDLAP